MLFIAKINFDATFSVKDCNGNNGILSHMYQEDAIFIDDLQQLTVKYPNFKIHIFCTTEKNRVNTDIIEQLSGNLLNQDYLICGPKRKMQELRKQLLLTGVSSKRIHLEQFKLL